MRLVLLSAALACCAQAQGSPFRAGGPEVVSPVLMVGAALPDLPPPPTQPLAAFGPPRASVSGGVARLAFDLPPGVRYAAAAEGNLLRLWLSGAALRLDPLPASGYGGPLRSYVPSNNGASFEVDRPLGAASGWRVTEANLASGGRVLILEFGSVQGGDTGSGLWNLDRALSRGAAPSSSSERLWQLVQAAQALPSAPVASAPVASAPVASAPAGSVAVPGTTLLGTSSAAFGAAARPVSSLEGRVPASPAGSSASASSPIALRFSAGAGVTRLVFDLAPGVRYSVRPDQGELKLTFSDAVDLKVIKPTPELVEARGSGAQWTLRSSRPLSERAGWSAQLLPAQSGPGARLVIELSPALADRRPVDARVASLPAASSGLAVLGLPAPRPRVVLDAGHGGTDPGTVGAVTEKVVTLQVAQRVSTLLREAGFDVTMTRESDRALMDRKADDLAARGALSAQVGAQLFVSIHVNALAAQNALRGYGVETWWNPNHPKSHQLASALQAQLVSSTGAYSRGIHDYQSLGVLRDNAVPAALVEIGFASHPVDGLNLKDANYLERVALGIANGIRAAYVSGVRR